MSASYDRTVHMRQSHYCTRPALRMRYTALKTRLDAFEALGLPSIALRGLVRDLEHIARDMSIDRPEQYVLMDLISAESRLAALELAVRA